MLFSRVKQQLLHIFKTTLVLISYPNERSGLSSLFKRLAGREMRQFTWCIIIAMCCCLVLSSATMDDKRRFVDEAHEKIVTRAEQKAKNERISNELDISYLVDEWIVHSVAFWSLCLFIVVCIVSLMLCEYCKYYNVYSYKKRTS